MATGNNAAVSVSGLSRGGRKTAGRALSESPSGPSRSGSKVQFHRSANTDVSSPLCCCITNKFPIYPDVMCGAEVYMLPSVGVTGSEQPWPNPPREQPHGTVKMGLRMVEPLIDWLPKLVFISGNMEELQLARPHRETTEQRRGRRLTPGSVFCSWRAFWALMADSRAQ